MKYTNDTAFKKEAIVPIPNVKDRPICAGCHKPRKVWRYEGQWKYDGYGFFCTLRCATKYANSVMKKFLKVN